MKRLIYLLVALPAFLLATVSLQSCLDDNDQRPTYITIGTIHVLEGKEYYVAADNGTSIYPGDTTSLRHYTVTDGQRVIVHYTPLEESVSGYDVNAQLFWMEDILTKDILTLTDENSAEIGNDRINAASIWIAGDCLNIKYQLLGSNHPQKKHLLNMVILPQTAAEDDEYITLQFRHNAYDDQGGRLVEGPVSFKLAAIADQLKDKKGVK
ncbi:MAG: NigD-like protein, partial [Prevotellaceae bacterium]|nr:NigD-like protein [Prevotellaceae bacterium]